MTNSNKIRVGVIFGGRSGEHEVSLVSATSIIRTLDSKKYEVIPIGITKEGEWIVGENALELLKIGEIPKALKVLLPADPTRQKLIPINGDHVLRDVKSLNFEMKLDVIVPILHGPYGEDGSIQGFLELTNIPYVGCGILGSAVCMDKDIQKRLCIQQNLLSVKYFVLKYFYLSRLSTVSGSAVMVR